MKGKGPKDERETIIIFNEEEQTASMWTASEAVYRRLKKAGYVPAQDNERSASFEIPRADQKGGKQGVGKDRRQKQRSHGGQFFRRRVARPKAPKAPQAKNRKKAGGQKGQRAKEKGRRRQGREGCGVKRGVYGRPRL